ncbi:MAG: cytochrome bc complex cytochrome b subunit [Gammaproteobacteria bacterium]|nr:cytochrome bc complex cytochrome b subunit [Gammaproteobacteria bacterium]MCF6229674.1 cytochrome bc complex cytochrome b subunit [Gammaproteobacteria bacterium]
MKNKLLEWVDDRFPLTKTFNEHLAHYYVPKNFNMWYFFGSLAIMMLVIQIVSGIFLTMNYKPDGDAAFGSVEYIMRDVEWGWLIRYMHSTGASFFFIVIYLHMFRGLLYGSYKKPRELVWMIGVGIFLLLMAEAFMGYLLPWGQMSYWGAQVIISLFGAVPFVGPELALLIRGDFVVADATLNRFFAFHVIAAPLVLLGLVVVHITALHEVGSNNPDGVDIKKDKDANGIPLDGIPFHPYYTVKDAFGASLFLIFFCVVMFYWPEGGGYFIEAPNFVPADPLKTPDHIAPVWYFTPFYTILRAVPSIGGSPFPGVVAMGISTLIFMLLPWLDRSPVKSIRYRSTTFKLWVAMFVVVFFILGFLGTKAPSPLYNIAGQICTVLYFAFFVCMPWYTKNEKCKPVPERVTDK